MGRPAYVMTPRVLVGVPGQGPGYGTLGSSWPLNVATLTPRP